MPRATRLLSLASALALSACLAGLPPPHGLTGGEELGITHDTPMQQIMGGGLGEVDHLPLTRGKPGSVLPAGARVQVTDDYVERRRLTAPNASLVHRNPWLYVRVTASPIPAQIGWEGWVHLGATSRDAAASRPAPLGAPILARASKLCPAADSPDMACSLGLDPEQLVRVLGCTGQRIHVELWDARGLHVNGFVAARQFSQDPCRTAAME